jgi:hypothetical protein
MAVTNRRLIKSDRSLVLACRRGEAEAWEVLENRYQRLIFTILLRAGLDEDRAAEVFQHTFTALLEHLDRLEEARRRLGRFLLATNEPNPELLSPEAMLAQYKA